MSIERPKPCCTTLWTLTRTREDLLQDPGLASEIDLTTWAPLVEWGDHVGMYLIGHTAIFYCPWCGTRLPDRHEEALAEAKKSGTWIEITADGQINATLDGQPIAPPEDLLARLKGDTKEQD